MSIQHLRVEAATPQAASDRAWATIRAQGDAQVQEVSGGGLTAREREVARLVARGLSNREIADALALTERTVESHLTHIFGKLGLRSRSQLTAWAIQSAVWDLLRLHVDPDAHTPLEETRP